MKKIKTTLIPTAMVAVALMAACTKSNNQLTSPATPPGGAQTELQATTPQCLAYVGAEGLHNIGCYLLKSSGKPLANIACLFAGNINYHKDASGVKKPVVSLNGWLSYVLDSTTFVKDLQAKGIKVTLSLLNNWDGSGWANFKDSAEMAYFARSVKKVVDYYGLDGIETDDEYAGSPAQTSSKSYAEAIAAVRRVLPNKIIGMYIYSDQVSMSAVMGYKYKDGTTCASKVTYGVGDYPVDVSGYTSYFPKNKLFYSCEVDRNTSAFGSIEKTAAMAKNGGYAGVMLFGHIDSTAMANAAHGLYVATKTISISGNCMQSWNNSRPNPSPYKFIVP